MIRFALPLLLLATAGTGGATEQPRPQSDPAKRDQAKIDKALAGLSAGAPQRCLRSDRVIEVQGAGDEILFVEGRNKVWRNKTTGVCTGLKRDDLPIFRTFGREYCAGDMVETRARTGGMITGACALGDFVPYSK